MSLCPLLPNPLCPSLKSSPNILPKLKVSFFSEFFAVQEGTQTCGGNPGVPSKAVPGALGFGHSSSTHWLFDSGMPPSCSWVTISPSIWESSS